VEVLYDTLPDDSWFRLIILQPSEEFSAPMQCTLQPFVRTDARRKYETLSYAWNEGDRHRNIITRRRKGQLRSQVLYNC